MPSSYGCRDVTGSEQWSKGANSESDSALEVTKPRDGRVAGGDSFRKDGQGRLV